MQFTIDEFRDVFNNEKFSLPIRWNGLNFVDELSEIYELYHSTISNIFLTSDSLRSLSADIKHVCNEILRSVKEYFNGRPSQAFSIFDDIFKLTLMENQFSIYNTFYDPSILQNKNKTGRSKLFRVRKVNENRQFQRKDIFHIPFSLRSKVGSDRYSIAGYPSLYLSSSLELCLEEMNYDFNPGRYICSRFEMVNESNVRIIELGIKPTDFFGKNETSKRFTLINKSLLQDEEVLKNYYLWFPLIVACSFMRVNKGDPFAAEYIVPQLLMQSIRNFKTNGVFMGIRYFSCASYYSSELGFNYVLPTNYDENVCDFCPVLSKSFLLTKPFHLNEYKNPTICEMALRNASTDYVYNS